MKIHGLVVSVDYAAELAGSVALWTAGLSTLVVVTTPTDEATASLAIAAGARLHRTGAFYEEGAFFNKARAMQEARELLPSDGWHLFLDADVAPPPEWLRLVVDASPIRGAIHGAARVDELGNPIYDAELAGFFHLFHSRDPRARGALERNWLHAGNYDSSFLGRWPRHLRRLLPLTLRHTGPTGVNWCGRGNEEKMRAIRQRRKTHSWRTETIPGARQ